MAKKLQKKGGACYDAIVEHFGQEILDEKGELDRARLGDIVFADRSQLSVLNRIVHPAVKEEILKKIRQEESAGIRILFMIEAALLIEDHYDQICDEIVVHLCGGGESARTGCFTPGAMTRPGSRSIMRAQLPKEMFLEHCDRVVDNSGVFAETMLQLDKIIKEL